MVIRNILTSIKVGDLEEGYDLLKTLRRINSWSDQIFCYLQLTLLILNFRPNHTSLTELQTLSFFKFPPSIKRPLLAIGPLKLNKRRGRL